MIESAIVKHLEEDPEFVTLTGSRVFIVSAPQGTKALYVVVSATDSPDESDAIAVFDITIDIYDYREDLRPIRAVSKKIKELLHAEVLQDDNYADIRIFLESRTPIKEPSSALSRINMQFSARATELLP
jgi:hypothetical protein